MFTKFHQFFPIAHQICDLRSFVAISICCNLRVFPTDLYPQKVSVDKKITFSNFECSAGQYTEA